MATFSPFSSNIIYSGSLPDPAPADRNNTDNISVNVKLYVEGVQVPFEAINISQIYNELPTAIIQIPPESGLLDILRGYQPKVHIFYDDINTGGDRLLFWGHITDNNYSKSRVTGSSSISFRCTHKNRLAGGFTLDYTGWASEVNESFTDSSLANQGGGVKPAAFNSDAMIIQALTGINGVASGDDILSFKGNATTMAAAATDKLDPSLSKIENRLVGMPGVAINLWNQVRKSGFTQPLDNIALGKMWVPLIDEGISFFKRMSGHNFLESQLQSSKEPYCHTNNTGEKQVLVPPYVRNSMISAIQREAAVRSLGSIIKFSGELVTFPGLLRSFFDTAKYDMLTLACPAEIPADSLVFAEADSTMNGLERCAVETVIKPQMPNYYSPTCNVILPRMFTTINITQTESAVPTRITAYATIPGLNTTTIGMNFRAPASVREAIALNSQLKGLGASTGLALSDSKGLSYAIPGMFEQGQGINPKRINLPNWLILLIAEKQVSTSSNTESLPDKGGEDYKNMMLLATEWNVRYASNIVMNDGDITKTPNAFKQGLNPYSPNTEHIQAYDRVMFAAVEDDYATSVAGSRSGVIDGIFNPYIIPGYPMDIIDDSPNHPSFHGFCTSVTHSITSRSISTTIGAANLVSYAELSNYYMTPVPPYLQTSLGMVNGDIDEAALASLGSGATSPISNTRATLLQNPLAKANADIFYRQVLGVGSVAPDDLIHFSSNRAFPVERKAGVLIPKISPEQAGAPDLHHTLSPTGREGTDYYSSVGNLRLVRRSIESKAAIMSKFSINFIDLTPIMYNSSYVNYVNPILAKDIYLEPGASMFLDYMETTDFIGTNNG